jgi:uncharacterized protein
MKGDTPQAGPRARAFVDWTLRYGRWIWLVAILLAIPAAWRTGDLYLHLKSELEELLPREAPSVLALEEMRARTPGLQYLGVVVDTGDAAHLADGERFIDDLAARIRTYPPDLVRAVRTGTSEERLFLEKHASLYLDVEDLQRIRERIEARRDWEVAHETGSLLEDDNAPSLDISDIEKKYKAKLPERGGGGGDRYSSADLHLTMLIIEVGAFDSGTSRGKSLLAMVKADIAALGGTAAYAPGMRLGYSGDVAISVEELDSLIQDVGLSSVLVTIAVIVVLILYYRWTPSILVLVPPVVLAATYAFALASLPPFGVTSLNSNTAFLGSIILGNGVNFGVILLARYVEERRVGADTRDALVIAVASVRVGTFTAAVGAGVAYASLISTQFRGFRQFGIIGGIGMVLSWGVTFVCMPPLIAWLDRKGRTARVPERDFHLLGGVARVVQRFALPFFAVGTVVTILAGALLTTFDSDQIEHDFGKLRRRDTWVSGEGYWGQKMDTLLGRYLTPTAVLADSRAQADAIAARLRDEMTRAPLAEMVSEIRSIDDVLPSRQEEKISEVRAIRADMTPKMRSLLSPEQHEQLDRFLGDEDPQPITVQELPRTFTMGLVERDGTVGRTVLVFPRPSSALWEGPPLVAFVNVLRETASVGGARAARVAGSLPLSADIIASVRRDGALASVIAFGGVVAVVLATSRRKGTAPYVIVSLAVGVVWMIASTMVLGVKINFANFIAIPITFGNGVDYAVNVMSRYVQDGKRDVVQTIKATGGAVALCSAMTLIGYGSLLVAENRALYLFGLLAEIGELTSLAIAVMLLPAALTLFEARRSARRPQETPGE